MHRWRVRLDPKLYKNATVEIEAEDLSTSAHGSLNFWRGAVCYCIFPSGHWLNAVLLVEGENDDQPQISARAVDSDPASNF
jgi:hypothetical protein